MFDEFIMLEHGAGGKKSAELTSDVFLQYFENPALNSLADSTVLQVGNETFVISTDACVVDPIFFPNGDIGKLAICNTINNISASGAMPLTLTSAFMLEEGFEVDMLKRIAASMRDITDEAEILISAGDTKVVPKGAIDRVFICITGIGKMNECKLQPSPSRILPGDVVIISGTIADHGMSIMAVREGIRFSKNIASDCAPLNSMVNHLCEVVNDVHCMRDPGRGGLASVLCDLAVQSMTCIRIDESAIPIEDNVLNACQMLDMDPLCVANAGKMVVIVPAEAAHSALSALKIHKYGRNSHIIGRVEEAPVGKVFLTKKDGSTALVEIPIGDLIPRVY